MSRPKTSLIAAFLLVVTLLSGWGFAREYRVFLLQRGTTNDRIAALAGQAESDPADLVLPISVRSQRELMLGCAVTLLTAPALKRDADLRARVSTTCGSYAGRIADRAPALPSARNLQFVTAPYVEATWLQAQNLSSHEPAMIWLRLIALQSAPDDRQGPALIADVDAAMAFPSTRRALAQLYLSKPAWQGLITERAARADPRAQADFLAAVRQAMRGITFNG